MTRTGAPEMLCANGEQVLALASAGQRARSAALLRHRSEHGDAADQGSSAVPLFLSRSGRWQQHDHDDMLCASIINHHDIDEHGHDMAVGAVQYGTFTELPFHNATTPSSLKTIDTVLRSPEAA